MKENGENMEIKTDIKTGLTNSEVEERVRRGENNGNFDIKTKSVSRIIKDNVFTLFNLINVILAFFIALTGSWRNMLFMGVILCNIAIGIFQEIRSKRIIDKLSLISAPKAHVIRNGEERETPVSEIVLDDIMLLNAGGQVCADGLVAEGECEADESMITGESEPVLKKVGDEILSGSFIVSGTVKAAAIGVGAKSYANKITSKAKYVKKQDSEMMRSINKIIGTISVCILPFSLILFFKAIFITNQSLQRGVVSTAAAIIGMIPEGLVLLTSLALAVSSIKLAQKQTLCQDLFCVESLARVDVLCLDKTGTITEGCMEVTDIEKLDEGFDYETVLKEFCCAFPYANSTLSALRLRFGGEGEYKCTGTIPFSSARKWSAAGFDGKGAYILGAPNFILKQDALEPLMSKIEEYSSQGIRVLLLAKSESLPKDGEIPPDAEPKALIALSDKIRDSAPQTLDYFKRQGVTLKVISGDAPETVSNIAQRAGLEGAADNYIDASKLSDKEIAEAAEKYSVFGRVTPYQKLELVKALKAKGHKVAMTGDGVNDVMALKEADCSIAMQSGSDAARNVSQVVLLNSDFASMPLVVEEGRRSINNIQRSAALFLVKTIFSFLLAVLFLFVSAAYPFQPIQLTLISAITIGIPSFLLTLEINRNRVEGSFLSNVLKNALPGGLTVAIGIAVLLEIQSIMGIPQERLSVIAVFLTAASGFGVLFDVCRPFTKMRAVMFIGLLVLFVFIAGFFGKLFFIVDLTLSDWAILLIMTAAMWFLRRGIYRLISGLKSNEENRAVSPKIKKTIVTAVFIVSGVFALWFAAPLTDYFSLMNGNAPIIARKQDNGEYSGIFYDIKNGEIHMFGSSVNPAEASQRKENYDN